MSSSKNAGHTISINGNCMNDKHFFNITRSKCALDRRTMLCLHVPGFQKQVVKHVENFSEQPKKKEEQRNNKGSVLLAEIA